MFQSFAEQVKAADDQLISIEDNSITSNNFGAHYLTPKGHGNNSEISTRDGLYVNIMSDKFLGQKITDQRPLIPPKTPMRVNVGSNVEVGGPRSMDFDTADAGETLRPRSSTPRDLLNNQMHSPIMRKSFDMRGNSFEGTSCLIVVKTFVTILKLSVAFKIFCRFYWPFTIAFRLSPTSYTSAIPLCESGELVL